MRLTLLLMLAPLCASALLRMEQVLVEEPARTNRDAVAWAESFVPMVTDVATTDYLKTLTATSMYSVGLSIAPGVLSDSTERFSTSWDYVFRQGGGIAVSNLTVRNELTSLVSPLAINQLLARFVLVTNSGTYGSITADTAAMHGAVFDSGNLSGAVTVYTGVIADTLHTTSLAPTGGVLTVDSPVVYFAQEPIFTQSSDIYKGTEYGASSSFDSLGTFNLGKYGDGVMWLTTTNMGLAQFSEVQSVGLDKAGPRIRYDVGGGRTAAATWSCVPLLITHYDRNDLDFPTGFWEYSQQSVAAAYTNIVDAVELMFDARGEGDIAGFTNATDMVGVGISPAIRIQVEAWYSALPSSTTNYHAIASSVSNYVDTVDAMFVQLRGPGTVCVVDKWFGFYLNYSRYRQMLPEKGCIYRVTMQLHLAEGVAFSTTPSRYWLVMNGTRRLVHTVSSEGESGASFTFLGLTDETPGYLYLDLSEFAKNNKQVLNATYYYVKLELLKGLSPWQH